MDILFGIRPRSSPARRLSARPSAVPRRLATALLAFTGVSLNSAAAGEAVSTQVRAHFAAVCTAIGAAAPGEVELQRAGTWVRATSPDRVFVIDLIGNRSLRPASPAAFLATTFRHPLGSQPVKPSLSATTRAALVDRTWELARKLADVQRSEEERTADQSQKAEEARRNLVTVKQEILLVCRRDSRELECFAGRYLVRLRFSSRRAFQVMYTADGEPLRIDTNLRDSRTKRLADALANQVPDPSIPPMPTEQRELIVGTFFSPGESRYELRACSFEGVPFLDLSQRRDPFRLGQADMVKQPVVDTAAYRRSRNYHHCCWDWWTRYGRVGAVRGNRNPYADDWEYPRVRIKFHKNMAGYQLVGGEPPKRKYPKPDKVYEYPFAPYARATAEFYEDLERCDVAAFFTHGGDVGRRFRFMRSPDVWIVVEPPAGRGLGSGKLRHLFWDCCGGMSCVALPDEHVLLDTWLYNNWIDGVRTICGNDGGHAGLDRSGWRFFGHYNKGDSISEAWAASQIDEVSTNCPATVAYGADRAAALDTLYTDRFSRASVKPTWAAVSIWTDSEEAVSQPNSDRETR